MFPREDGENEAQRTDDVEDSQDCGKLQIPTLQDAKKINWFYKYAKICNIMCQTAHFESQNQMQAGEAWQLRIMNKAVNQ